MDHPSEKFVAHDVIATAPAVATAVATSVADDATVSKRKTKETPSTKLFYYDMTTATEPEKRLCTLLQKEKKYNDFASCCNALDIDELTDADNTVLNFYKEDDSKVNGEAPILALTMPKAFCGPTTDTPGKILASFIFDSMSKPEHIILISYYEMDDVHSALTFKKSGNSLFVDAVCVNNAAKHRGGLNLIKDLISVCARHAAELNIKTIKLKSVERSINSYQKANFKKGKKNKKDELTEMSYLISNHPVSSDDSDAEGAANPLIFTANDVLNTSVLNDLLFDKDSSSSSSSSARTPGRPIIKASSSLFPSEVDAPVTRAAHHAAFAAPVPREIIDIAFAAPVPREIIDLTSAAPVPREIFDLTFDDDDVVDDDEIIGGGRNVVFDVIITIPSNESSSDTIVETGGKRRRPRRKTNKNTKCSRKMKQRQKKHKTLKNQKKKKFTKRK